MAAGVESARATMLEAARRRDRGLPFSRQASIAKLVATDAAMRVTTDAVQVLGGYGYTRDYPVDCGSGFLSACYGKPTSPAAHGLRRGPHRGG